MAQTQSRGFYIWEGVYFTCQKLQNSRGDLVPKEGTSHFELAKMGVYYTIILLFFGKVSPTTVLAESAVWVVSLSPTIFRSHFPGVWFWNETARREISGSYHNRTDGYGFGHTAKFFSTEFVSRAQLSPLF